MAGTQRSPASSTGTSSSIPSLTLQLLLQLGEEAPVRTLGQELLWAALEHPDLVQAQGVEAQGVLGAILTPLAIGDLLEGLEGIVIALRIAFVHNELGYLLGLAR